MELHPQAQSEWARKQLAEMDTKEPSSLAIWSELVHFARFPLTSDHDWAERATIELARLRAGRRSALAQTQGDGGDHAKVVEAVASASSSTLPIKLRPLQKRGVMAQVTTTIAISQKISYIIHMTLPFHYHAIATPLPSHCLFVAHVIAMSLPCHCHIIAMTLPCHHHVIAMSLRCA